MTITRYCKNSSMKCYFFQIKWGYFGQTSSEPYSLWIKLPTDFSFPSQSFPQVRFFYAQDNTTLPLYVSRSKWSSTCKKLSLYLLFKETTSHPSSPFKFLFHFKKSRLKLNPEPYQDELNKTWRDGCLIPLCLLFKESRLTDSNSVLLECTKTSFCKTEDKWAKKKS